MSATLLPDTAAANTASPGAGERARPLSREVQRHLLSGTSMLGAGVLVERGLGFAANILAARLGGTSTFGAYSLAYTTASNISTYAAGGIGATAARFSGKYPFGSSSYPVLARALALVSLLSAALAAAALWLGAGPLAHLLGKASLESLLRWAALSSAGIVLLECARGFFVGQRRLHALLLLSLIVGFGMVLFLPAAASHHGPARMILLQGAITITAVAACLLLRRPLGLLAPAGRPASGGAPAGFGPMLGEIWRFGAVQLAGLLGINLAGWWLTTLIARADTTLVQMSFFAIANQLRNIIGLAPSLLTEGSYAVMARVDPELPQKADQTPDQVMALCTYLAAASSLLLAAPGMLLLPWALTLLYGPTYHAAAATAALGLAIAVVHMGNGPAAARLTIVSIRTTGIINTIWAVAVASGATLLLFHHGRGAYPGPPSRISAGAEAMAIYLAGHILSAVLVVASLARRGCVPAGMLAVFSTSTIGAAALAALACLRAASPAHAGACSAAMLALLAAVAAVLLPVGRRHHWLPSRASFALLCGRAAARLQARFHRRPA